MIVIKIPNHVIAMDQISLVDAIKIQNLNHVNAIQIIISLVHVTRTSLIDVV